MFSMSCLDSCHGAEGLQKGAKAKYPPDLGLGSEIACVLSGHIWWGKKKRAHEKKMRRN